jgi:hypothetical protein
MFSREQPQAAPKPAHRAKVYLKPIKGIPIRVVNFNCDCLAHLVFILAALEPTILNCIVHFDTPVKAPIEEKEELKKWLDKVQSSCFLEQQNDFDFFTKNNIE